MTPDVRRDLSLLCQLDHANRRRVSPLLARAAFQRCLQFPRPCFRFGAVGRGDNFRGLFPRPSRRSGRKGIANIQRPARLSAAAQRAKSNAASPPARSSAPGHHHTKNKGNGERLERNLPNQLGKDIEWHVRLPGGVNSLPDTATSALKSFCGLIDCRFRYFRCRAAGVQCIQCIE
jgi:hypothetical protein